MARLERSGPVRDTPCDNYALTPRRASAATGVFSLPVDTSMTIGVVIALVFLGGLCWSLGWHYGNEAGRKLHR
jgi:hypothetical protein